MAKSNGRKSGTAIGAGALVALLALLGIGEFGIGGFGGGMVSEVFAPNEEAVVEEQQETSTDYYAVIEVVDEVITVDGKEVAIDDLATNLASASNQKVLLKDNGATHGVWTEVKDILSSLDCIIETQ